MLVSCKYCGGLHERGVVCASKPVRQKEPNQVNKFRWSRVWRTKRNQIVDRDKSLCQVCKQDKQYTYDNLEVHHITSIADDWDLRLDDSNLVTLCVEHHKLADANEISKEYLTSIVNGVG